MFNKIQSHGGIGNKIGFENNRSDTVKPAAYIDSWVVSTPYRSAG